MTEFELWFSRLHGAPSPSPHVWQQSLAAEKRSRSRFIRIPTGMGKTLGVLAAWTWNRLHRADDAWPRRLVWCLPMRVLVEQTEAVVRQSLNRIGLLWSGEGEHTKKVGVHLLMGGADEGGEWTLYPEEPAVLIGTQDMLLSRALNRGYAAGRARWPLEFGLLNHDALWIMDEVQLMDVGLATGAQIQAYRDEDEGKSLRPCRTWWMSATLQPTWLRTIDTEVRYEEWCRSPMQVGAADRNLGLGSIVKSLATAAFSAEDANAFASRVMEEHQRLENGEHGKITLVVCNTVDRACKTFDALQQIGRSTGLRLVHGRFRPAERAAWREEFLARTSCVRGVDLIIVSTQVVEAGVDVSAGCVVTELAPWSSLVQRFGRCARYGGVGKVLVVDRGRDEKTVRPYRLDDLEAAWSALLKIGEVGTARLEEFEEGLGDADRSKLYPYSPQHLLLRREFEELFDTTPDLTGADLDISRFIRGDDERDLQVFWEAIKPDANDSRKKSPADTRRPRREELCAIPFMAARDWLFGEETKQVPRNRLRGGVRAWIWDWLEGEWVTPQRSRLVPGSVVCVAADVGGYRVDRGFTPESWDPVPVVPDRSIPETSVAAAEADERQDGECVSAGEWKTIATHCAEVARIAGELAVQVQLPEDLRTTMVLAAKWHDVGKAHPAFQGAIRASDRPNRVDLAKAPKAAWPRPPKTYRTMDDRDLRPGLRHELASALAIFAVLRRYEPDHPALLGPWTQALQMLGCGIPEVSAEGTPSPCEQAILACSQSQFDLLVYLVASHHGKVRMSLHAAPRDQDYPDRGDGRGQPIRGIREGDMLPSVSLDGRDSILPALTLTLDPATLGLSPRTGRSWRERTLDLLVRYGPGALAWMEALLIAADRRGSRLATVDTLLETPVGRDVL